MQTDSERGPHGAAPMHDIGVRIEADGGAASTVTRTARTSLVVITRQTVVSSSFVRAVAPRNHHPPRGRRLSPLSLALRSLIRDHPAIMEHDNATDTTRPEPTERDATDPTDETLVLSVADAAELLGVSTGAIRKRIERGQLNGRKVVGQWRVVLTRAEVEAADRAPDATSATRPKPPDATRPDTTNQTDATRCDRSAVVSTAQAEQMAALVASIQAPLLDRIEAAVTRAVNVEQRLAAAEQERDELRRLIDAERMHPDPAGGGINRKRDSLEPLGLLTEPESETSPENAEDAPGRANPLNVSMGNSAAVGARRSVFEDLWHWLRGR
jgi:hypothetical protein